MAVVSFTTQTVKTFGDQSVIATWTPLLNTDSGTPLQMTGSADRSVQLFGTFGAGGTVLIEGSNDGVNYATLKDPANAPLSITAAGVHSVLPVTAYIRPRVSAGDGTTSLSVIMLVRRPV
jgi:hypothetical protein